MTGYKGHALFGAAIGGFFGAAQPNGRGRLDSAIDGAMGGAMWGGAARFGRGAIHNYRGGKAVRTIAEGLNKRRPKGKKWELPSNLPLAGTAIGQEVNNLFGSNLTQAYNAFESSVTGAAKGVAKGAGVK